VPGALEHRRDLAREWFEGRHLGAADALPSAGQGNPSDRGHENQGELEACQPRPGCRQTDENT